MCEREEKNEDYSFERKIVCCAPTATLPIFFISINFDDIIRGVLISKDGIWVGKKTGSADGKPTRNKHLLNRLFFDGNHSYQFDGNCSIHPQVCKIDLVLLRNNDEHP